MRSTVRRPRVSEGRSTVRRPRLNRRESTVHTSPSSTYRISVSLIAFASICCFAQTNVLTYRNDNMRTAQNLSETMLTTANVKPASFGLLYNFPVDGQVYAQPLVVSRLNIGSMQSRNVVFVATEGDS